MMGDDGTMIQEGTRDRRLLSRGGRSFRHYGCFQRVRSSAPEVLCSPLILCRCVVRWVPMSRRMIGRGLEGDWKGIGRGLEGDWKGL